MAKPKSKPVVPAPVEDKKPDVKRKPLVIQVRGSDAYRAWVEKLARRDYDDTAGLVEKALRIYAKAIGFDEPQPER